MKIDDVMSAFEFASFDGGFDHNAFICRETGEIFWSDSGGDLDAELPEDIESDKYICVPDQMELNLGRELAMRFADEFLPDDHDRVRSIFSRSGAYRRFKDLLEDRDQLQAWFAYEQKAIETALRQWCREQGLPLED